MVSLAQSIRFPNPATREYVATSCRYGLLLYTIYRDGFRMAALGAQAAPGELKRLIDDYDKTWTEYRHLKEVYDSCATLYTDKAFKDAPGIGAMVDGFRKELAC